MTWKEFKRPHNLKKGDIVKQVVVYTTGEITEDITLILSNNPEEEMTCELCLKFGDEREGSSDIFYYENYTSDGLECTVTNFKLV